MSDDVGNIQQEQAHVEPQTQAPQTPDYASEALSLIHISEPTRPY